MRPTMFVVALCLTIAAPHDSTIAARALQTTGTAQESLADAARRKTFDQILDLNVRDGFVYYRALKSERAKLDGFVNLLANVNVDRLTREEQLAFWLNAYNAIVLRTVVDHYPIAGSSKE